MAETDMSLLEILIGDVPPSPAPTHIWMEIRLGGEGGLPTMLEQKLLTAGEPFVPYLVLETESVESAERLGERLIEAKSGEAEEGSLLSRLPSLCKEYGELNIQTNDSSVVLSLVLEPIKRQQVEAYMRVLGLQASEVLAKETTLKVLVEAGCQIDNVLASRNAIGELCNAMKVRVEVTVWKGIAVALSRLSELMSASPSVTTYLSAFGFYRSANLQFRLNSLQDLPESVQALIPDSSVVSAVVAMGKLMMSQGDIALLRGLVKESNGTVVGGVAGKWAAGAVRVKLVGGGNLLD